MLKLGIRKGQGVDRGVEWKAWLLWLRVGGKRRGLILGLYIERQKEWRELRNEEEGNNSGAIRREK